MTPILLLFFEFLRIGMVAVGGGYAMIPLMQAALMRHGWMPPSEFLDILAVSEMTPGPIAINAATFVGYRVAGGAGAIIATLGVCLPGFTLMLWMAHLTHRFQNHPIHRTMMRLVRPVVCALLLAAAYHLGMAVLSVSDTAWGLSERIDWRALGLFGAAMILTGRRGVHPMAMIGAAALAGLLLYR